MDVVYVYDIVYDIVNDIIPDVCVLLLTSRAVPQVKLINAAIAAAKQGSPLYKKPQLQDPCEKLIEAHVATLEWHMQSRIPGPGSLA